MFAVAYREGRVGEGRMLTFIDLIVTLMFVVAYRRGGAYRRGVGEWGGGMLTFIESRHQKMLLRWCSLWHTEKGGCWRSLIWLLRWCLLWHTEGYRRGVGEWGGGMLTFTESRHQKMLLRWCSLWHTEGVGWGGCWRSFNCITRRLCYVVVFDALQTLLCWGFCYVEGVVPLKMSDLADVVTLMFLIRWRCGWYVDMVDTLWMLLRWSILTLKMFLREDVFWYVEDVVMLKMW